MVYRMKEGREKAAPLFKGWKETVILSCLQGVMGEIYVDDTINPHSAMMILGDFCFFAGKPSKELVAYKPADRESNFIIMVPENPVRGAARAHGIDCTNGTGGEPDTWEKWIEDCYGSRAKKGKRYAIQKEADVFEREKLEKIAASLPQEYMLKLMDEELYDRCKEAEWSRDFVAQYSDYAAFQELGLGVAALERSGGALRSAASSYSTWNPVVHPLAEIMGLFDSVLTKGGIEIEIATEEAYQRKGLALACGARLILECMERGLYPSWDARTMQSVALSEKLGYHYECDYDVYEIFGY